MPSSIFSTLSAGQLCRRFVTSGLDSRLDVEGSPPSSTWTLREVPDLHRHMTYATNATKHNTNVPKTLRLTAKPTFVECLVPECSDCNAVEVVLLVDRSSDVVLISVITCGVDWSLFGTGVVVTKINTKL